LTIKTAEPGIQRHEYEYAIPLRDAEALLLQRDGALITKTRHIVPIGGLIWEIDVFDGENAGLTIAEVELGSTDQILYRPEWLGREVTHERRYYNSSLAKHPVRLWQPALVG
jgi:adenylate cyclase